MAKSSMHGLREDIILGDAYADPSAWSAMGRLVESAHSYWGKAFQFRLVDEMERRQSQLRADNRLLDFLARCAAVDLSNARLALERSEFYDFQWFCGRLAAYALMGSSEERRLEEEVDSAPPPMPVPQEMPAPEHF